MNIQELIKGIIIGIAKIIPGLSGAVLMISFNLYDRAIDAITNFFYNPKKNFFFLFNLGIGIIIGIVFFSKILSFFINKYYLYTTTLFLGMILGGIPIISTKIKKKRSTYLLIILSFIIMSLIAIITPSNNYIPKQNSIDFLIYFLAGLLEAFGTVLPGISSTALLMFIGVYDLFLITLSNLFNINILGQTLSFIIPFSLGLLIGIISISILVNYLFKFYKTQTFSIIFGISLATVLSLILRLYPYINSITNLFVSLIFLCIGYLLTSKLT